MKLFNEEINLIQILNETKEKGYSFSNHSNPQIINLLLNEIKSLPLEHEDSTYNPLNKNKSYQVTQSHKRYYRLYGDSSLPSTNFVYDLWQQEIGKYFNTFPELKDWSPKEIGCQCYNGNNDHISPHRDRWSDRQLSITYTLSGSAIVKIYKPLVYPVDYNHIEQIDEFTTISGTVMFLRASSFGNGEQIIHEVLPPILRPRYIVNLRTRDTCLNQPKL